MTSKAVTEKARRSKHQAGLDVSPQLSLTAKKPKKNAPKVNAELQSPTAEMEDVELTGSEEVEQDAEPEEEEEEEEEEDKDDETEPPEEEEDKDDDTESPEEEEDKDDETEPPEEEDKDDETEPPINGVSTPSETQTQQSDNQVKKTRGPTKMRKVAKHIEDKVEVEFNALGEHVGRGSVTLSSFLGPLVREHVSVLLDDWRHLEEKTKDAFWEEIHVILSTLAYSFINEYALNFDICCREDST